MRDEPLNRGEDQWLDSLLDQVADDPLPSHLAARLAEVPLRYPRESGRAGARRWSWGGELSWLSWGAAAVLGTVVGLVDTVDSEPAATSAAQPESIAAEAWSDDSEQPLDEWQQLSAVAFGTDWDGEL